MRLLLIRHGETVDNVAGNYAGTTDSPLTNHGVLQASRLGTYLATNGIKTACIFSSDLQRAFKTADAIRIAQAVDEPVIQLPVLREQDFGYYEGKRFFERPKESMKSGKDAHLAAHKDEPGFVEVESKEAMKLRADTFVHQHLLGLMEGTPDDQTVVVVAHGIILNHLWRSVLQRFDSRKVSIAAGVAPGDRGLEYLGGWSNTGYLDLEVKALDSKPATSDGEALPKSSLVVTQAQSSEPPAVDISSAPAALPSPSIEPGETKPKLFKRSLVIKAVNSIEHLKGLKKTKGGIGSLKHDSKQKTMDSFFKKRKLE